MPRIVREISCCLLVLVGGAILPASAAEPFDQIMPATTKGFVSVEKIQVLTEQWRNTQLAALINDPVMQPFIDDMEAQFEERINRLRQRLGLTINDLRGVPTGELAVAAVQPAAGQGALALLVDVTGNTDRAKKLLEQVSASLAREGARRTERTVGKTRVIIFDLPKPADRPQARDRQAVYFLAEDRGVLGASDNFSVIQQLLNSLYGGGGQSLAKVAAYQEVMKRTGKADQPAHLRWFINPIDYVRVMRAIAPEPTPNQRPRRGSKTLLVDVLEHQGFTAIEGAGGVVNLSEGGYELFHRTAVFAPPPYAKAMKMMRLPNHADFTPQAWVPRDIATYTTFYVDILNAFDNFGPLFDELFGEGEKGIWQEVLESLEKDPAGPRINLREELIAQLGQRVTAISDYQTPITPTSERLLFAVEAKNPEAVAKAIAKSLQNDPAARRREIEIPGSPKPTKHVVWEIVEADEAQIPEMQIEVPQLSPFNQPGAAPVAGGEDEEQVRLLPHAAVTVAHGQLMLASHLDYLVEILSPPAQRETLSNAIDYRIVQDTLAKFAPQESAGRSFSRTEEEYRPTYELIRQGKMPESETILARLLNMAFGDGKPGAARKQRVSGEKLPDYQVVRRYLGPAGVVVTSVEDGWFAEGFMLRRAGQ